MKKVNHRMMQEMKEVKKIIISFMVVSVLITVFIFFAPLLSGDNLMLELRLASEDTIDKYPVNNITLIDLTPYPTLKRGIDTLVSPTAEKTSIRLKIDQEEMNSIRENLQEGNSGIYYNYLAFEKYIFTVGCIA